MNFADAIRQAAMGRGEQIPLPNPVRPQAAVPAPVFEPHKPEPSFEAPTPAFDVTDSLVEPETNTFEQPTEQSFVNEPTTSKENPMSEPHSALTDGTVVRFEMFLTPEQLSSLFRAVVANQHTVLTSREAAHHTRVPATKLEALAQKGEIPAFNVDGRWRFPRTGLDHWLEEQAQQHKEAI